VFSGVGEVSTTMQYTLLLVLILSFLWIPSSFGENPGLEVSKTVTSSGANGVFTVKVGYRVVGTAAPGRVFGVRIVDSFPNTLELVSGELVVLREDPTSEEWTYNTYQVRAKGIEFTIEKRSVDIELPPAEITYSISSGNTVTNKTVFTQPTTLTAELVIPKGTFHLDPLIAFFTLVSPVLAAVFAIPHFRKVEIKNRKKKTHKRSETVTATISLTLSKRVRAQTQV